MFKKFKNALNEVTEEVKSNPRFQNLNQLANTSYSNMNSVDGSLSGTISSEVFLKDSTSEFFTLGEEGDSQLHEDDFLFPSYEAPLSSPPPNLDMESSATEAESSIASESAVSKEQLYSMLSRSRSRYHKYKSRYAVVVKAYQDLNAENQKISNVMHQTQDKALRRISELREQCQLSQKAKQHLEEEAGAEINKNGEDGETLVIVDMDEDKHNPVQQEKMVHLEEKVKRLENLLTKCKESITANKQKNNCFSRSERKLEEASKLKEERDEALKSFENLRTKDQNEELQIAESKMMVHQRELKIIEDEMKTKLIEKEDENRLALEEKELRIKSMITADEKKSELLRNLETNLKLMNKNKGSKEKRN
ncbi:GOLGA4 [Lepeophtheirus salmonis]|uniref:GOLGA4 n=1 Tax=Lepeophtheirus salmonis TaxID=72036 RepID=A0A7R8D5M5_LEPSM|nr:GOLGA4 [Lepeophtheirus salmonis]CAF3006515.1 GOLGA4 [Lepeophtheirus salmonis]